LLRSGVPDPSFSPAPLPPRSRPLSLHDALPIWGATRVMPGSPGVPATNRPWKSIWLLSTAAPIRGNVKRAPASTVQTVTDSHQRSEEHTSELQSRFDLVCRLLLEKKKQTHSDVA